MSGVRIAAALALAALLWIGASVARPSGELRDYGSFVASGRAAAQGLDPYGIHPLTFHVVLPGFEVWNPNLNPPISLPVFTLFDRLPPATGFVVWWLVSLGCYLASVLLLLRSYRGRHRWLFVLWALALAGFWDTLVLGQIYLPLVLATVAAWQLLDARRPAPAALLIGVVIAVKPNFALWPALLFVAGHRRIAYGAVATAAVLWSVPLLLYGPGVYYAWIELVLSDQGRAAFLTNTSLPGLVQRLGMPGAASIAGLAVVLGLTVRTATSKPNVLDTSALGIVGGIAASPIAWVHYTLFLLPVFTRRRWTPLTLAAAALLVVPVPWVLQTLTAPAWVQLTLGSVYSWAVLVYLIELGRGMASPQPDGWRPSHWRRLWTSNRTTSTTTS